MKKVVSLVFALMIAFTFSAYAADGTGPCPDCPKTSCDTPRLCKDDQDDCEPAQPCNVVFYVCECGPSGSWNDGDFIGISVTSLTEGVYISSGDLRVSLFENLNEDVQTTKDVNDACDYLTFDPNDDGTQIRKTTTTINANYPVWDFIWKKGYTPVTSNQVGKIVYQDKNGDEITDPDFTGVKDCSLDGKEQVKSITTCGEGDNGFILDVAGDADDDDDLDTNQKEDAGKNYLLVKMPQVAVNWSEVEAAGLLGTVAMGKVCVLDMKDADSGLCTDCTILCCCDVELVELCTDQKDKCVYIPYALYGIASTGWSSGVGIANISLDNASSKTIVPVSSQVADVTIIDEAGSVFTGTLGPAMLDSAIKSFSIDTLIDTMLGITGVQPGNVYVKFETNFDVDLYAFHLLSDVGISFGAGHLGRSCVWNTTDVFVDSYMKKIKTAIDKNQ